MDLSLRDIITLVFVFIGMAFMFIAGVGILRMPDLFLRMSMTTKASTLGVGSMLIACLVYFSDDQGVMTRTTAIIIFILLTAPVSAHMIGRAAYIDPDVQLWKGTIQDDLQGQYDLKRRILTASGELEAIDLTQIDQETIEKAISG